jgi:hypothetical protein
MASQLEGYVHGQNAATQRTVRRRLGARAALAILNADPDPKTGGSSAICRKRSI